MISKKSILVVSCFSLLALTACEGSNFLQKHPNMEDAKYWQRKSASSALYLQGPKAQQMLHKNIAACVTEINELENLGAVRRAVPANYNSGNTTEARTASQETLDQWDSPQRDGYLYAEHLDYHDFETCMDAKGWERAEWLPYTQADKARKDYLERYGKKKKDGVDGDREVVTTLNPSAQNPPPYENTNE